MPTPQGTCSACARPTAITPRGVVRQHLTPADPSLPTRRQFRDVCPGSGLPPATNIPDPADSGYQQAIDLLRESGVPEYQGAAEYLAGARTSCS